MHLFQGPFYRLHYPDGWEAEIIENIPAFYDPEGGGALQIVAARRDPEMPFDIEAEMTRYLERHGMVYSEERVARFDTAIGMEAMACEFMRDNRFWLVQMLCRGDMLLLILFNSDTVPDQELALKISAVIRSVQVEPPRKATDDDQDG